MAQALWLVKDDVATTAEANEIIGYSFGLRWAQMGLFETYRVAGGEARDAAFYGCVGHPAWPWTRLMDVPELDEALIEKIAASQMPSRDIIPFVSWKLFAIKIWLAF